MKSIFFSQIRSRVCQRLKFSFGSCLCWRGSWVMRFDSPGLLGHPLVQTRERPRRWRWLWWLWDPVDRRALNQPWKAVSVHTSICPDMYATMSAITIRSVGRRLGVVFRFGEQKWNKEKAKKDDWDLKKRKQDKFDNLCTEGKPSSRRRPVRWREKGYQTSILQLLLHTTIIQTNTSRLYIYIFYRKYKVKRLSSSTLEISKRSEPLLNRHYPPALVSASAREAKRLVYVFGCSCLFCFSIGQWFSVHTHYVCGANGK